MVAMGSFITRHSISLFFLLLAVSYSAASDFKWSDCGVQLTKDIHYESVTISSGAVTTGPLSIHISATIVNTIYGADTWLMVYKDGETFLNVQIQDLCDIVATNSLNCPLQPGLVSFTYTFNQIPALPKGFYEFQIRSYINYIGVQVNNAEQGCLSLSGTAGSIVGSNSNTYTSSFVVTLSGSPSFQVTDYSQRAVGNSLSIGTSGVYGKFASTLKATQDLGGVIDMQGYQWALSGSLVNMTTKDNFVSHSYKGTFQVYASDDDVNVFAQGSFNFTNTIDTTGAAPQALTGTLSLKPKYIFDSSRFTYPVVIGNMDPFQVTMMADGATFVVSGSHTWCTAGFDACGECGGDGTSCGLGAHAGNEVAWTSKQKAAVAIGVGGGVLGLIAITVLAIMISRAKRQPRYDDTDLIDHPQKPDYGTMAIDDIMREGERAPY